jgi:hypothetical protein
MKCLRTAARITKFDRLQNEVIRERLKIKFMHRIHRKSIDKIVDHN